MQSDVPPLPISCLTDTTRLRRTFNIKPKPVALEETSKPPKSISKPSPNLSLLTTKKRLLRPLLAGCSPYKNISRYNNQPDTAKSTTSKSAIDQRVSSAKMLRIKQLQNQLADAHFHLNELSNENKLLKAIQKRQDTALNRYEGSKAELPRIINTHQEDFRVLQTKYKKLRSQYKDMSDTLKEKESELHSLQAQNKKLVQLSKDRHLLEREKLQMQVFDLNHRVDEQDEIIQTLKRKLELEKKYLKHQLHTEMVKHKEALKQLQDTQLKLKSLEELAEQKEKRSYHASHIFFHKDKPTVTSQSLTNLNDQPRSERTFERSRRRRTESTKGQSLPSLNGSTPLARSQSQETPKKSSTLDSSSTCETYKNSESTRRSSLPKSPLKIAPSASKVSLTDSPIKESQEELLEADEDQASKSISRAKIKPKYELPKSLREEYGYLSDGDRIRNSPVDSLADKPYADPVSLMTRSRLLHTRLISSAVDSGEPVPRSRGLSFSSDNYEDAKYPEDNDGEIKYDRDSVITVISREALKHNSEINYSSSSDLESEMEIPIAFNLDEDENVKRTSDVIIDDYQALENQRNSGFHSSNNSFQTRTDFKDAFNVDGDKGGGKLINGILAGSKLFAEDVGTSIDDLIARKKTAIKAKSPTLSVDYADEYEKAVLEDFITNEAEIEKQERDNRSKDTSDFSESETLENNYKNFSLSDKINSSPNESDLKCDTDRKTVNENSKAFDKAKLLAAMKAIDDNENIEFIDHKPRKTSATSRLQITENLYRGVPTHSKKKSDIMKELFSDVQLDNKKSKENLR